MGTDIRWIIERRHQDGSWHAVFSKVRALHLDVNEAWRALGLRNYELFGILSGIRYEVPNQAAPLARPGLPDDVSAHAASALAPGQPTSMLHDQGWMTLGELREAARNDPDGSAPDPENLEILREWHNELEARLGHLGCGTIFGAERHPGGKLFSDMENESNHARIARLEIEAGLAPIADDTLRVLIAYDS